jgi:uncharacterized protein (TIGR02246 family)
MRDLCVKLLFSVVVCVGPACSRTNEAGPGGRIAMNEESRGRSEEEIRALVERLVRAVRAKDLDQVSAVYAPDLVAFDIVPPLQYVGAEAYKKPWRELFELYEDGLQYEVRDLSVTAGDDVAFSHSLNHLMGTMKTGRKTELWLRFTAGYRKIQGKWLIVHLQASVPVDMAKGKALVDLKP